MGIPTFVSRGWRCLTFAVATCVILGAAPPPDAPGKLVFFDPGANQYDLQGFSGAFSRFLEQVEPMLLFQVVRDAGVLGDMLHDEHVHFAMVPAEFLHSQGKGYNLVPLLVPTMGGDAYYRKLLVDNDGPEGRNLQGKGIAASGMAGKSDAARIADELEALGVVGARIVTVPKDIDALLALSFGQVDAALVAPVSIDVLRQVNPQITQRLRTLAETNKILRSPLCAVAGRPSAAQTAALLKAVNSMADLPEGRELMGRLAIDGWIKAEGGSLPR